MVNVVFVLSQHVVTFFKGCLLKNVQSGRDKYFVLSHEVSVLSSFIEFKSKLFPVSLLEEDFIDSLIGVWHFV